MNSQLPYWVQLLQALSTPAIALLAVVIGVMQWRTSHQRAVLDLFEKRWQAYKGIREVISEVVRSGSVSNEATFSYLRAIDGTEFLFGPEVYAYLRDVHKKLAQHHTFEGMAKREGTRWKERQEAIDKQSKTFEEIAKFYDAAERLIAPYVRMHQKSP